MSLVHAVAAHLPFTCKKRWTDGTDFYARFEFVLLFRVFEVPMFL